MGRGQRHGVRARKEELGGKQGVTCGGLEIWDEGNFNFLKKAFGTLGNSDMIKMTFGGGDACLVG